LTVVQFFIIIDFFNGTGACRPAQAFFQGCWREPVNFEYAEMNTIRRCPVCRSTVNAIESTRCPECGALLDREDSADSASVDDILKTVKEQITPLDDSIDRQSSKAGRQDEKDVAALLSGLDFQAILDESLSDDELPLLEDGHAFPENPAGIALPGQSAAVSGKGLVDDGEDHSVAFSKVLESYKQTQSHFDGETERSDTPENGFATGQESGFAAVDRDVWDAERPYYVRPENGEKQVEPERITWWGYTRQTLWLLLILLVCIVFFRLFGPERKEPTIEDYFRPGNPDVELLDAINFLEKYHERQRKQQAGNAGMQAAETPAGSMQPSQPADDTDAGYAGQASDNSTPRDPFSPASGESTP
jgi:hypothetical protein